MIPLPNRFIALGMMVAHLAWPSTLASQERPSHPNVLLIILDDFAPEWSALATGGQVRTPNLERLRQRSMYFRQAQCAAPSCCPSRTSLLTGVEPCHSGVYLNNQAYRRSPNWIAKAVNLPQHFRQQGYLCAAFGKVSHHDFQEDDATAWTAGFYEPLSNEEDVAYAKHAEPNTVVPDAPSFYQWGPLPDDWDRADPAKQQQDTRNTNRAIDVVQESRPHPFFCALGLFRPHLRWYAARRYFDLYPLESIKMPPGLKWDDLDDLPPEALKVRRPKIFDAIVSAGLWKQALQAYMASITYADEQVGRVFDALERGPNAKNTIVAVISDNGWHNGDKLSFSKFTLWEQSTRVAFLLAAPGLAPGICDSPVSLVDLFPTLNTLCGLPGPSTHSLDGVDLAPLLTDPTRERGRPVLTTQDRGNHAVRSRDFRYIHYATGGEELYDRRADPYEWHNLASDPRFASVRAELARWLPKADAESIPPSGPAPR